MKHLLLIAGFLLIAVRLCSAQSAPIDSVLKSLGSQLNSAFQTGDFAKAAGIGQKLITLSPTRDSGLYYITSVAFAMAGDSRHALHYLDTAAQLGYHTVKQVDGFLPFLSLKDDSTFRRIVEQMKATDAASPVVNEPDSNNIQLAKLHDEDQADRAGVISWFDPEKPNTDSLLAFANRDSLRLRETYAIINAGKLTTATDYRRAALILQHGHDSADYRTAHELAMQAVSMGDGDAKWLAAATLDRYLVSQGKRQKFGTQSHFNKKTGKYELDPYDPSTTDKERMEWNVPPLKQLKKQSVVQQLMVKTKKK